VVRRRPAPCLLASRGARPEEAPTTARGLAGAGPR
jgi:hypothetical protein